jgi:hypothetical protein
VLSPVFRVDACEIQAFAASSPEALQLVKSTSGAANRVYMMARQGTNVPAITLVVRNTSDQESRIVFAASFDSVRPSGRRMSAPQSQWRETYDLVMQPGETREIEARPNVSLGVGTNATLVLRPAGSQTAAISALSFSVLNDRLVRAVLASQINVNGVDLSKPVTFVTQNGTNGTAANGVSQVQAAVLAGLMASRASGNVVAAAPAPAPDPVASAAPAPEFSPAVAEKLTGPTPIQAAVIAGLKASREKGEAKMPSNVVARADEPAK